MRTVSGAAVVPAEAHTGTARLRVEVRDVALADAPSVLLAARTYPGVQVRPGARLPFTVTVDDVPDGAVLSLRVHVDVSGDGAVAPGDLLSTQFHLIPTTGATAAFVVPLTAIT